MGVEEEILEKVRALPAEKKQEVLHFVGSLIAPAQVKTPLISPRGLWKDFDIDISEEDIAELRRELWKNFPREDV